MPEDCLIESGTTNQDRRDSPAALERLIRLDRKNSSFDFVDPDRYAQFRVRPSPLALALPPRHYEHSLKLFWRHINNYYFNPLSHSEYLRLQYFEKVLAPPISDLPPHPPAIPSHPNYAVQLQSVFDPNFLRMTLQTPRSVLNYQNATLQVALRLLLSQPNLKKKRSYEEYFTKMERVIPKGLGQFDLSLRNEHTVLSNLIEDLLPAAAHPRADEVGEQLQQLCQQIGGLTRRNKRALQDLKQKLRNDKYAEMDQEQFRQAVKLQLRYLGEQILRLQTKQVAQSIGIVLRCKEDKSGTKFQLQFDQSLDFKNYWIKKQKLNQLNKLRQISLFGMYNVAQKGRFSYAGHNTAAIWQAVGRKSVPVSNHSQFLRVVKDCKEVELFQMCHHCKQIFEKKSMVRCEYRSSTHGVPMQSSSAADYYYTLQILQCQKSEEFKRALPAGKNRNPFLAYCREGDQFYCGRYFCKGCLKQNYDRTDPLCPFCQGLCFCSRCNRNDTIVKLKSLYLLLGGDIEALNAESLVTEVQQEEGQVKGVKKEAKSLKRNIYLRRKLEEARHLCDLTLKRERTKLQLLEAEEALFMQLCHEETALAGMDWYKKEGPRIKRIKLT